MSLIQDWVVVDSFPGISLCSDELQGDDKLIRNIGQAQLCCHWETRDLNSSDDHYSRVHLEVLLGRLYIQKIWWQTKGRPICYRKIVETRRYHRLK